MYFLSQTKKETKFPATTGAPIGLLALKALSNFAVLFVTFFFVFRRWECKARCPPPPLRWTSWASPLTVLRSRQRQGTVELVWDGWIMDKGLRARTQFLGLVPRTRGRISSVELEGWCQDEEREGARERERERDRESARGRRFGGSLRCARPLAVGCLFVLGCPSTFCFFVVADDIHDVGCCMCVGRERDTCVGRERRVGEIEAGRERGG